jgi:hypothetical protein
LAYESKIETLSPFLSKEITSKLASEIDSELDQEYIDYSYLNPSLQYSIIKEIEDTNNKELLIAPNLPLINKIDELLSYQLEPKSEVVQKDFGFSNFAKQMDKTFQSFNELKQRNQFDLPIQEKLIKTFAQKEYIRLIYS